MTQLPHSGFVGLFGVPNAGKSSLVNALTGELVSVVTAKPQTTRRRTLGILTRADEYQIIFVDTPGLIDDTVGLNPYLKYEYEKALNDVDVAVFVIAPWEFTNPTPTEPWFKTLYHKLQGKPVVFVATQVDKPTKINREAIWNAWWSENKNQPPLLLTSCVHREGLQPLLEAVRDRLKPGPYYYDPADYTTQNLRDLASEIVRKNAFESLRQEVPYGLAVLVRQFQDGSIARIHADVIVQKERHKSMVIGRQGAVLKEIGTKSRIELEKIMQQKVYLELHVTAKPWLKDRSFLSELGYSEALSAGIGGGIQ